MLLLLPILLLEDAVTAVTSAVITDLPPPILPLPLGDEDERDPPTCPGPMAGMVDPDPLILLKLLSRLALLLPPLLMDDDKCCR